MKKTIIVIAIIFVIFVVGILLYLGVKEKKVVVLAYHKVVPSEIKKKNYNDNPWVDTTERFEKQMKYLHDMGYTTLSMDEYEDWRNRKKKIPLRTVMITIDDGDVETYYEMMPILKKYNLKATYFVIGEKVHKTTEKYDPSKKQFVGIDIIESAKKEYPNIELQSHSYSMHNESDGIPYVLSMTKEEISNDFEKMKFLNTDIFCYPYGVHSETLLKVLEEKKYRMAFKLDKSGISTRSDNKYLIKRVGVNYDTSFQNFKKWLLKGIIL